MQFYLSIINFHSSFLDSCENGPYDGDDACTLGSEVIPRAHRVSLLTRAWTYDANKPGVDRCVRVDACHYNIRPGNNLYYTLAECRAACVARV